MYTVVADKLFKRIVYVNCDGLLEGSQGASQYVQFAPNIASSLQRTSGMMHVHCVICFLGF